MLATRNTACEIGSGSACENGNEVPDTVQSSQAPTEEVATQPDPDEQERELEQAVLEEDAYQAQRALDKQVKEHDELVAAEEAADAERYDLYQKDKKAQRAQEWEDWALFSELNPKGQDHGVELHARKRTMLRVMVQQHNGTGKVRRQETFQMDMEGGNTITMGFQLTAMNSSSEQYRASGAYDTVKVKFAPQRPPDL